MRPTDAQLMADGVSGRNGTARTNVEEAGRALPGEFDIVPTLLLSMEGIIARVTECRPARVQTPHAQLTADGVSGQAGQAAHRLVALTASNREGGSVTTHHPTSGDTRVMGLRLIRYHVTTSHANTTQRTTVKVPGIRQ